ncbi:TIGR03067 domain-containing protein [Planctomicrobium piriforme]|nr:TIGR03067 domain-containing protein [Planctomicrobium piriforme]
MLTALLRVVSACTVLSTACLMAHADDATAKCDPADFDGTYKIVSGEMDGKAIPPERLHHVKAVFTAGSIVTFDKDENQVYAATFTLGPAKNGCHINMTSQKPAKEGSSASGLIKKDGDTVSLIYALPSGELPTSFKTHAKQHLFIMKKVTDAIPQNDQELKKP